MSTRPNRPRLPGQNNMHKSPSFPCKSHLSRRTPRVIPASGGRRAQASASRAQREVPRKAEAVYTSLHQREVFDMGGGRSAVPLLLPEVHGLPFGMAIELTQPQQEGGQKDDDTDPRDGNQQQEDAAEGAYHLHYVMCGQGRLSGVEEGSLQSLVAGDSLVGASRSPEGPVRLEATAETSGTVDSSSGSTSPGWDPSETGAGEDGGGAGDLGLVTLRVVFPLDICDERQGSTGASAGERDSGRSAESSAASLSPAVDGAARSWCRGRSRGPLGSEAARRLLAGAQEAAKVGLEVAQSRAEESAAAAAFSPSAGSRPNGGPVTDQWREALERHLSGAAAAVEGTATAAAGAGGGGAAVPGAASVGGGASGPGVKGSGSSSLMSRRHLMDVDTFQLPNQSNLLALVFDPLGDAPLPFTFGIEVFQQNHETPPHKHEGAHELFFVLSGAGTAFCDDQKFEVQEGDTVVFPPGSVHGIDNGPERKMYLLELMVPNDAFAEFVRMGMPTGLEDEDLCVLIGQGCALPAIPDPYE